MLNGGHFSMFSLLKTHAHIKWSLSFLRTVEKHHENISLSSVTLQLKQSEVECVAVLGLLSLSPGCCLLHLVAYRSLRAMMLSNLLNFFLHWNFKRFALTLNSEQHSLESSSSWPHCLSQGFASPKCVFSDVWGILAHLSDWVSLSLS